MKATGLARAAAAPAGCALLLLVLMTTWVAGGGGGTVRPVRIAVTRAAIPQPARSHTGRTAAYLTIRNLSGNADHLLSATSPAAARILVAAASGIAVPAHATVSLSPFGADLVLIDPRGLIAGRSVVLRLRFRRAGLVTVLAAVTPPGTP